jgi:hypothetical protein
MKTAREGIPGQYLTDSLDILRSNCYAYRAGCKACYRVLAAQMRILCCDRKREHGGWRENSLLALQYPELTLERFPDRFPLTAEAGEAALGLPWIRTGEWIPLGEWLKQDGLAWPGDGMSVRDLIKYISEKDGGAHIDPRPGRIPTEAAALIPGLICDLAEYLLLVLDPIVESEHDQSN